MYLFKNNYAVLIRLLTLKTGNTSTLVDDLDGEVLGTLDDCLAGLLRDIGADDCGHLAVLHHEHVEVLGVLDVDAEHAVVVAVAESLLGAIADLGHGCCTLVATTHGVVDTVGLTPAGAETTDVVALEAVETVGNLLVALDHLL